ncbi:Uncharacterised protein [[Clostridium] sordellii]|nr:Uncharacterised protein [[Clostridium] sordellii] [Paeniclostridium sordellii]
MDTIEKLCSKYSFINHLDVDVKERKNNYN